MDMLKSFIELNKKALRKIKKKHKKNQPNDKDVNKVTEFKLLSFSSAFEEERVKMVTNSPPCSSGFVNSRTLTGCTDPLQRMCQRTHQCPLSSLPGYLCHFMLTCGCTFR